MQQNILLCGVGGQGIVLASRLLAVAGMAAGYAVKTCETIGMAQRGGSVTSHVRIGESASPLISFGQADILLGFEPGETARNLPYLKEGGLVLTAVKGVMPVTASLGLAYDPDACLAYVRQNAHTLQADPDIVCEKLGSYKVRNVALLGALAASGALCLPIEAVREALQTLPPRFLSLNQSAFDEGAALQTTH